MRIRTAHFPAIKTLEDFNLEHLPSLRKDLLAHLATVTFVPKAENVVLLGPPGIMPAGSAPRPHSPPSAERRPSRPAAELSPATASTAPATDS